MGVPRAANGAQPPSLYWRAENRRTNMAEFFQKLVRNGVEESDLSGPACRTNTSGGNMLGALTGAEVRLYPLERILLLLGTCRGATQKSPIQ